MSAQIKDRLSQLLNRIKDSIEAIHEDSTDQEIEQAPKFDEFVKPINSDVVPTQTQEQIHPIKVTNVHETEFLENEAEMTQHAKLQNSEHKLEEDTTEEEAKTKEGSRKL